MVVGVHSMIYLAEQETVEWILNIERGGKCNKALCQDKVTNGLIRHTLALIEFCLQMNVLTTSGGNLRIQCGVPLGRKLSKLD